MEWIYMAAIERRCHCLYPDGAFSPKTHPKGPRQVYATTLMRYTWLGPFTPLFMI